MRRPRPTLRLRLTLVYGGLFFAAWIVLLGVTYVLVDSKLPRGVKILTTTGEQSRPVLRTADGEVLNATEAVRYFSDEQAQLREESLSLLLTQGGIAMLVIGSVSIAFGWLVAGRVLGPLHRVTDTARRIANAQIADRSLHERIALDGPDDEVKELADAFDSMVHRLDQSFDGQRRFVANASHELRTPLTLNRALVELAMHRKSASADVKQLGESLLEINTRHERLINGLLLLARTENEIVERVPVDLADVVTHVVAQADRAGITVREELAAAPTAGDPVLLERLVQNLIDNAIRHNTPSNGYVRVMTRVRGGSAELEVRNSGPVIAPYDIPTLFEPFRRLDTDRLVTTGGAGLGLSIVRSVARAHGGAVTATPREGGGLVVAVTLPLTG
ncbi:sensor histidine kinase [Allorhizocola rhizosphaerae]|uniref:sensor histidine kinase n=1 Tax=Allorhizocola rhizosphaerae TaxID=1872709 RepID=UPI000E3DDC0E|nr:HAMP domain-containing sensor histidine kinase [Allorhizocola rhizosphaerae]